MTKKIKVAIAGLGNCASSLIQGLEYYKDVGDNDELVPGLMHNVIGDYKISDIEVVAAFDIDKRKVGKDISEAMFEKPNNTTVFCSKIPKTGVIVKMSPVLDGVAEHMSEYSEEQRFIVADKKPCNVVEELKKSGAQMLVNYMPVGSQEATEFLRRLVLKQALAL
jgi:myo-inositol-1-phosphate synthase